MAHVVSDMGWEPAPADVVTVTEDPAGSANPDAVLWAGSITFGKTPRKDQFRVVVREFESLPIDATILTILVENPLGQRLVYAAILPYDFPSAVSNSQS